jgi:alpha-beta hydrolase superfamily lysophospholipase
VRFFVIAPVAQKRWYSSAMVQGTHAPAQAEVRADERLEQEFPRIRLPLPIPHGTADRAARPQGSQQLFGDPLNDVDRETVPADFLSWLDARLS